MLTPPLFRRAILVMVLILALSWNTTEIYGSTSSPTFPLQQIDSPNVPQNAVPEPMVLVFEDNFEGYSLNWDIWGSQQYSDGLKRGTARGPENIEVADGKLNLHIRKEAIDIGRGQKSEWTAGFVYINQPVPNNTYLEARFKPNASTGVNNAFWLAVITEERSRFSDRYEIDIVETRRLGNEPEYGRVHLAWHDWKTRDYVVNSQGRQDHIAQGWGLRHKWGEYDIWGLWYGENEFIYYLNGEEVWRGTTHSTYHDQWDTGVGKFDQWFEDEEVRAYGRFGQDTWRYYGGYTGDRMNVIFATLPWEAPWTPLTDEADGTWMSVDYLRVFRPERLTTTTPTVSLDAPALKSKLYLEEPLPLENAHQIYAALHLSRNKGGSTKVSLVAEDEKIIGSVAMLENGSIQLTLGDGVASTERSWPASQRLKLPNETAKDLVLVIRITPDRNGTAPMLSACLFASGEVPFEEPYLYHNADPSGNTSVNQGWHLASKSPVEGHLKSLQVTEASGVTLKSFKVGTSFQSVARP